MCVSVCVCVCVCVCVSVCVCVCVCVPGCDGLFVPQYCLCTRVPECASLCYYGVACENNGGLPLKLNNRNPHSD